MAYTFDGPNKLIILSSGTTSVDVKDLYSRWKEWVQESTNSTYEVAFTSIGGESIGVGLNVATYVFLNTTAGWRIRPQESDHELTITGNLYSVDPNLNLFVPTLGGYTALVTIERSASAIAVTVGGIDQATVQAALTAQGYTTARSTKLDNIDVAISTLQGEGLTTAQATMLLEMYNLLGLDPTKPLVVTPTSRKVPANGGDINQTITTVGSEVTVQRV